MFLLGAIERNTLWMQGSRRGNFRDQTAKAGLLKSAWRGTGFGTLMGDFDQDGWIDIAVVNDQDRERLAGVTGTKCEGALISSEVAVLCGYTGDVLRIARRAGPVLVVAGSKID